MTVPAEGVNPIAEHVMVPGNPYADDLFREPITWRMDRWIKRSFWYIREVMIIAVCGRFLGVW